MLDRKLLLLFIIEMLALYDFNRRLKNIDRGST